jgi:hypothetical protein
LQSTGCGNDLTKSEANSGIGRHDSPPF